MILSRGTGLSVEGSSRFPPLMPQDAHLPNFLGVGPPRTGTTWLDAMMRGRVGLPRGSKETLFFSFRYSKGLDWYAWHFLNCPTAAPIGEFCPSYFYAAGAKERIAATLADCKIISTLRDPVERLYSSYRATHGLAGLGSFADFLRRTPSVVDASRYATHLGRWIELFGRANVLVLFFDDLQTDPGSYLGSLCDFIGVERINLTPNEAATRINQAPGVPRSRQLGEISRQLVLQLESHRMYKLLGFLSGRPLWRKILHSHRSHDSIPSAIEAALRQQFLPEVEALESMLSRDLAHWKPARVEYQEQLAAFT